MDPVDELVELDHRPDIGDAILARKDAPASYHLACVVDDSASTMVRQLGDAPAVEVCGEGRLVNHAALALTLLGAFWLGGRATRQKGVSGC